MCKDKSRQKQRTVVIIQRLLPHYRVAFFKRLEKALRERGVRLRLIYGQESAGSFPRTVHINEGWAQFIENQYWSIGKTELVWQNSLPALDAPDLVIVEQANRLLGNYPLLVLRALGRLRLAFWGHGRNLQSEGFRSGGELFKRRILKAVDWWFAYTCLSADIVESAGYPRKQITIVENSIDTENFAKEIGAVTKDQMATARKHLGLGCGPVALYCGGMYSHKRLDFLLEAVKRLRSQIADFNIIFVGGGQDEGLITQAAEQCHWIHYVGPVYGAEKAVYFAMSDVMLMPGLVGLAIVDCFVSGLPLITTDIPIHSPEIAYLDSGKNGILTPHVLEDYVNAVASCLTDTRKLEILRRGCGESANQYTLEKMVKRYSAGIMVCLDS